MRSSAPPQARAAKALSLTAAAIASAFSLPGLLMAGVKARMQGEVQPWRMPPSRKRRGVSKTNAQMGGFPKKCANPLRWVGTGRGSGYTRSLVHEPVAEPFVHVRRIVAGRRKWTRYTPQAWLEHEFGHHAAGTIVERVDAFGCVTSRERY